MLYLAACGGGAAPAASLTQPAGQVRAISTSETPTASALAKPGASSPAGSSAPASATPSASTSASSAASAGPVLKLGLMGPFSGQAAAFGQEMLKGAQLAIDEANSAGGAQGKRLVLDQADDKAEPSSAPAAAQKLVSDGVAVVIGPGTSGSAVSAESALSQAKLPTVTPMASDPRVTEAGLPFIFRATGRWDQEPPLVAEYLQKQPAGAKVALVADKSSYGQLLATGFRQAMAKAGSAPVADESVDSGAKDFGPLAAKLKADSPGAVFYGGYAPEVGLLLKALRAAGVQATLATGDAGEDQGLLAAAGSAADGLVFAALPDPKRVASASAFLETFRKRYGTPASLYAISTYDTTRLVADTLRRVATSDGEGVRQALAGTRDFNGAYWGRMSFDAKGDLQGETYVLWTVRGGKFEQLAG